MLGICCIAVFDLISPVCPSADTRFGSDPDERTQNDGYGIEVVLVTALEIVEPS